MSLVTDRKVEIFDASSSSRVLFCSSRWYADMVWSRVSWIRFALACAAISLWKRCPKRGEAKEAKRGYKDGLRRLRET